MLKNKVNSYPTRFQSKKGQISQERKDKETALRILFFPNSFSTQTKKEKKQEAK